MSTCHLFSLVFFFFPNRSWGLIVVFVSIAVSHWTWKKLHKEQVWGASIFLFFTSIHKRSACRYPDLLKSSCGSQIILLSASSFILPCTFFYENECFIDFYFLHTVILCRATFSYCAWTDFIFSTPIFDIVSLTLETSQPQYAFLSFWISFSRDGLNSVTTGKKAGKDTNIHPSCIECSASWKLVTQRQVFVTVYSRLWIVL